MALFFSAIPKIIGFVIIVVIGWFIASLIVKGITAILHAVRFNDLAERSSFAGRMGADTDSSSMIAAVAKWFVRLIALVVAFDALGQPAVSDVLRQLLLWLPNVVVALVVLFIGGLAASGLGNVVRGAATEGGLDNPNFLSKIASGLAWAFAIVVAVNQIGIATTLINTLFMAVVGAMALGLASGLGGRDTAGEIVRKWYGKGQANSENLVETADAAGNIAQHKAYSLREATRR